jgi:hypothetical protein
LAAVAFRFPLLLRVDPFLPTTVAAAPAGFSQKSPTLSGLTDSAGRFAPAELRVSAVGASRRARFA